MLCQPRSFVKHRPSRRRPGRPNDRRFTVAELRPQFPDPGPSGSIPTICRQQLQRGQARVGGTPGTVETVSAADVLRDFEEKVVGYLRTTQAAVPYLKQAGWGRVINISGGAGRAPGTAVSGGIRNIGTVNLTKSMANALGPYGINVNAIYPGQTITEATLERYAEQAQREGTTVEALHQAADERTALKHVVTATDIGYFVAMLCSPLTIGVHGEAIGIDGGNRADMHY